MLLLLLLRSTTTAPAARPMLRRCLCSSTSSPGRLVRWAVQEDGVATVTLSNPGKLNALTVCMSVRLYVCTCGINRVDGCGLLGPSDWIQFDPIPCSALSLCVKLNKNPRAHTRPPTPSGALGPAIRGGHRRDRRGNGGGGGPFQQRRWSWQGGCPRGGADGRGQGLLGARLVFFFFN